MTRGGDLATLAWPDLASLNEPCLLAVPVGSTEQHGPHLPLGTDTEIAVALARRLADRVPGVIVAPAVPYGSSGEHDGFEGTVSVGQEALELFVVELCRSASSFASGVAIISAHGGNAEPVARAVALLRREGRRVCAWSPGSADPRDSHAGHAETSVMLALAAGGVRMDRVVAGDTRTLDELMPSLRASGVLSVTPTGVLGDPTGASVDHGNALLDEWTRQLELVVRQL